MLKNASRLIHNRIRNVFRSLKKIFTGPYIFTCCRKYDTWRVLHDPFFSNIVDMSIWLETFKYTVDPCGINTAGFTMFYTKINSADANADESTMMKLYFYVRSWIRLFNRVDRNVKNAFSFRKAGFYVYMYIRLYPSYYMHLYIIH